MEVRLLGAVEVVRDGETLAVPGDRSRALLCLLALQAGQPVPVAQLTRGIWDDEPPANVRGALHTIVARLRAVVGDRVSTASDGYRLVVPPPQVDLLRVRDEFAQARDSTAPEVARRLLDGALAAWDTPFGDAPSAWLVRHRSRLVEEHLAALEQRVDLDLAEQRYAECLAELATLTEEHPLRETLWVRLLVALRGSGRRAEALDRYEEIRRLLVEELGTDPGPELQRLHGELLAGGDAPGPDRAVPRQLLAGSASFTGRDDELARLDATAERLVVLHGQGGAGKTALAMEWGRRVAPAHADGQLFVDLRGFGPDQPTTPGAALDFLLRSLGLTGEQIPSSVEERSALLRSTLADRSALLVLDNAYDAGQVRPLLPGGDNRVLVTSRSQLRSLAAREGAARVEVEPLGEAASIALLRRRIDGPTPAVEVELAELARLCGRLPVALTIAAERVNRTPGRGVADWVALLRDETRRLEGLATGDDALTDVRAVLEATYRRLSSATAALFRLLAVAPDGEVGVGLTAALLGVSDDEAHTLLDDLTECHLADERRPGWYAVHDLVLAYAREVCAAECSSDDRAAATTRLRSWCVHSTGNGRTALGRPPSVLPLGDVAPGVTPVRFEDGPQATAWFAEHRRILEAVVRHARQDGDHATVYRMARGLGDYYESICAADEERRLEQDALVAARAAGDVLAEAAALNELGIRAGRDGDLDLAMERFATAGPLFDEVGERIGAHRAGTNHGLALYLAGRHREAVDRLGDLVGEARQLGLGHELPHVMINLAGAYIAGERYAEAEETALAARAIADEMDDGLLGAQARDHLGRARAGLGDTEGAETAFREAIELGIGLGDLQLVVDHHRDLGQMFDDAGRRDQAVDVWREALRVLDAADAAERQDRRREFEELIAGARPGESPP